MPNSIRPGDVLADRYRLVDLLTESGAGRFWRAHDRVLERHVALHVIAADDERAAGLLEAARRSATVHERHLLRVLDADQVDDLCFVVNEWGTGSSLDVMLAHEGPLGSRRSAWLVAEVAESIAVAHEAGASHGRLVPENILVDHTGAVRVIGFAVDAALRGLPPGRTATDVADLGGLLYCALTGRWPGTSRSEVTAAPQEHGRILRPRQVRAGIPRPLDSLCDEVLNPYAVPGGAHTRSAHDLTTARGIADYLSEFVGDTTGMAEAEVAARANLAGPETVALPALPNHPAPPSAAPAPPEPDPAPPAARPPVEQPTQAGLPIFDDITDDVSWLVARETPAPPPPPFEEPPERPLFAPTPGDGEPLRKPRPGAPPTNAERNFWPWEGTDAGTGPNTSTGTGMGAVIGEEPVTDDEVPGRSWLRLAGVIAASLLLLVAVVVAYNLGRGKTPLGAEPDSNNTTSPSASATTPTALTGVTGTDFDPQGKPPEENPDLVPLALDGDPTTAWRTMTYDQNFGPGGLKTGVGLTLDLGSAHAVSGVDLTLVGAPTDVSIYVTDKAPSGIRSLTPAATGSGAARQRLTLDQPVTGRYVTVWLTSLPRIDSGFRGEIAEVVVRG